MKPDKVLCIHADSFLHRENKVHFKKSYLSPCILRITVVNSSSRLLPGLGQAATSLSAPACRAFHRIPCPPESPGQHQVCLPAVCPSQGAGMCQGEPASTGGKRAQDLLGLCSLIAPTACSPRAHTAFHQIQGEQPQITQHSKALGTSSAAFKINEISRILAEWRASTFFF